MGFIPGPSRSCSGRVVTLLCLLLYVLCLPSQCAAGQSATEDPTIVDLDAGRDAITKVSNLWKFHPGSDPNWALANFDDKDWKTLNPTLPWGTQGYSVAGEQAWFRFRLRLPANATTFVLQMPKLSKNYQLFADGRLVGQVGQLPPEKGSLVTGAGRVFTLPRKEPNTSVMTIALRVWRPQEFAFISADVLSGPVLVGTPEALLPQFARTKTAGLTQRDGMEYTSALLQLPIMAAALLLLFLTREHFYIWLGANMCLGSLSLAAGLCSSHFGWEFRWTLAANIFLDFAGSATVALFLAGYLQSKRQRLVWLAIAASALAEVGPALVPFHFPASWADITYFVFITTSDVLLILLVFRARRAGVLGTTLFLIPFALSAGLSDFANLGYILLEFNVPGVESWLPNGIELVHKPFTMTLLDAGGLLALFGYLALLVLRFARTSREQQRLSAALRAAHEIQSRLVPESASQHGTLKTEVVYLAAEEVGGDFCQILPRKDGSLMAVIGDVSGKGLQAAMIGALAVGALRSLVQEMLSPATVLERINDVMLRSDLQGFVTCLCLHIRPDGEMTVASAGHPGPYVNGSEIACEPGLPLGMTPDVIYEQKVLMLSPEARLTLLSDGVLEARSPSGELFGFDRTLAMSGRPAGEIAAAAQSFGQQDDITVVTLDWTSSLVPA